MKKEGVFVHLFHYMGGFKITMALSAVMAAVSAVVNVSAFVCVYHVAEAVLSSGGDFATLDQAYLTSLGWQAVYRISMAFGTYGMALLFSHITAFNTVANIRIRLMEHLGRLPLGYHMANPSGKLRKVIEKNTDNLETLISHHIPDFVQSATLPVAFLAFLFLYDWRSSLVCLIPILIGFMLLFGMLQGESEGFVAQVQKSGEDIGNAATEYVRGISVVKAFGQTAKSFRRYESAVKEYADFMTKYSFSMENAFSAYNTVINGIFFFLIPGGILLYNLGQKNGQTVLTFVFFAVLIPLIVTILTKIMHSSSNLMIAQASLTAIDEILAEEPLPERGNPVEPAGYDIALDHVSFAYEAGAGKALDDVSLELLPGTVTALVGESGGGKSTIANLIARFWDVQEGTVRIGGVDVRDMDYDQWMRQVSIVFQDITLFKMSILDNVAFYKPGATREEVLRALHLAQCDDILKKLPGGADTVIGTKGVYLSGGEVQRITLARAILKDAPVVLLDEATAFADAENEHLIQKALNELLRGKTVLMIAHRLSTVVHADQICVLERGKIAEKGTHRELMERNGIYAKMFREYQSSVSWQIGGKVYV